VQVVDRVPSSSPAVLAAIAVGGVLGATGRWAVNWIVEATVWQRQPAGWPWATLTVNIVGAFLIGIAARRIDRYTIVWAFMVTGILGGFTTFSALAVELNDMADADRLPLAFAYAGVTLAAGVAATAIAEGRRSP
jgi:CrcB protein